MTKLDFYWKFIEQPKRRINYFINELFNRRNDYIIQKECNKHRNELAIYGWGNEIYLLLGWTDQYEDDYYYVYYSWKDGIKLASCVGGFTWLKGKISGFEYYRMEKVWFLNNPSIKECLKEVEKGGIILK